jgi:hypothetical protein
VFVPSKTEHRPCYESGSNICKNEWINEKLFQSVKSVVEPASGRKNPFRKKQGVADTPLEAPYCTDIPTHLLPKLHAIQIAYQKKKSQCKAYLSLGATRPTGHLLEYPSFV